MNSVSQHQKSRLARRLGLKDAVIIGLAAMIGAGIFAAVGPAAAIAGSGLLISLCLAGLIAYFNASSMAQLAALYPESGGTYVYGTRRLGPLWGFLAGWCFVVGKIASCTAMALTFAYYAYPSLANVLAATSVLSLTAINYAGVRKTAFVTRVLLSIVLLSLFVVLFASLGGGSADFDRLRGFTDQGGLMGILQATGIMFFAFAGYARVATLGEEVDSPKETIPKAILMALGMTLTLYILVIGTVILTVDIATLAASPAPLATAVESGRLAFLSPMVRIGACFGSLGVLISLLAGVSRTSFAMADNGDLPKALSSVHPTNKTPHRAELVVGIIVASIVMLADVRSAIGFSSFAILLYYAIANASAWTLSGKERQWSKWWAGAGFISCLVVALSLPLTSVIGCAIVVGAGLVYFFTIRSHRL